MCLIFFIHKGHLVTAVKKEETPTYIYAETNPVVMGTKYWKIRKSDLVVVGRS